MLINFNLKESKAVQQDLCFLSNKSNELLIVAISVNDRLKASTDNNLVNMMMEYLKNNFETKGSNLDHFLRIEIDQRSDYSIFIHQTSYYCERNLEKFNMREGNIVHIPTDP